LHLTPDENTHRIASVTFGTLRSIQASSNYGPLKPIAQNLYNEILGLHPGSGGYGQVAAAFPSAPAHIASAREIRYSVVKLSRAVLAVDNVFAHHHLAELHCRSPTAFCHAVRRATDAVAEAALDGYNELLLFALQLVDKPAESLCDHDGIHCLGRRDAIID